MSTHRTEHRLRNETHRRFAVEAAAHAQGADGTVVRALVTDPEGRTFRFEVRFAGEYAASKPDFDEEMFLHMALSVVRGQIESHEHRDTRISITRESGLMDSEPGATLNWTAVG